MESGSPDLDGSNGETMLVPKKVYVGFYWDLENCPLPKGKNGALLIDYLRRKFVLDRTNHLEKQFVIASDVTRVGVQACNSLLRAGNVTMVHVDGSRKNAVDNKLMEMMRTFVDEQRLIPSDTMIVLISGDMDFLESLRASQIRHGCKVILLHSVKCSESMKIGWNEIYSFKTLCQSVENYPPSNCQLPIPKLPAKNEYNARRNVEKDANPNRETVSRSVQTEPNSLPPTSLPAHIRHPTQMELPRLENLCNGAPLLIAPLRTAIETSYLVNSTMHLNLTLERAKLCGTRWGAIIAGLR